MSPIGQFVEFLVDSVRYGIEIRSLLEVVNMVALTPVPAAAAAAATSHRAAAGLVDIRGRVLLVLDMRALFDLPAMDPTTATRILVVKTATRGDTRGERRVGLIVDGVLGVAEPSPDGVSAITGDGRHPPGRQAALTHVCREDGGLVLIVDVDRLLADLDLLVVDRP